MLVSGCEGHVLAGQECHCIVHKSRSGQCRGHSQQERRVRLTCSGEQAALRTWDGVMPVYDESYILEQKPGLIFTCKYSIPN